MFVAYLIISIISLVALVALVCKLRWAFLGLTIGALIAGSLLYFFELSPLIKLIVIPFILFTGWGWGWDRFSRELDN